MKASSEKKDPNSYKNILKGTSLFGGVQIFQILINLLRGKFVAMFLGPEGMGIASMLNSSTNTVIRFASLGLNLSFVKEIAAAKSNSERLAAVSAVAGTLIRFTGVLGALACALASPLLSEASFGTRDYAWQYVLLAIAVYLTVAGNGKLALLQGLHKARILSLTSLVGAATGLIAGVPLYYFFADKGIVPAMILLALTTYLSYSIGLRKSLPSSGLKPAGRVFKLLSKRMMAAGAILLASSLINTLCTYLINIFVRIYGDISDVGLFNAANSITLQYAGVVFTAMSLDYFPRLSAASGDRKAMRGIVDRQMEIVALISSPLSLLLIVTAPVIITLLLTSQFLPVTGLMRWLGLSILLKALAYPLGYIAFAKNNPRLFFWLEAIACNVLYLGCSLLFYYYFGLMGLGYGAVVEQGACIILYIAVNLKVYGYFPSRRAWLAILTGLIFTASGFAASLIFDSTAGLVVSSVIFVISAAISFRSLRKRLKE